MGLNLGAFAGGMAKGAMDTYTTLKDQQRRDEEAARQAQEFEWRKQAQAREAAIEQAAAETQAKVGGTDYAGALQQTTGIGPQQARALAVNTGAGGDEFDRAVAESDQGVLRENAQRQGAALPANAPVVGSRYTQEQADIDYLNKVRGISRKAAREEETGMLGLKAAQRQERYAVNQEHALGFQQNVMKDLQDNGGDVGAVIDKHLIPLYNENKLPGLNDGGTAKVVPNAMGGGKSIIVTGKDGKETTMPADIKTLQFLTGKVQELMMASSSPENYWKHKEYFLNERKTAAAEKQADTQAGELAAKISAGLFKAQANQANAAAGASSAHAEVYRNILEKAKTDKAAGEAMAPVLQEIAELDPTAEGYQQKVSNLMLKAATLGATKSKDLTQLVAQLRKPDRAAVSAEQEKAAWAAYNDALNSPNSAAALQRVKAAYPAVFGGDSVTQREKQVTNGGKKDPFAEDTKKDSAGGAAGTTVPKKSALPDPREAELDLQTRKIEQGKLSDYTPKVKAYIAELDAARRAASASYADREREQQLAQSRALGLSARGSALE